MNTDHIVCRDATHGAKAYSLRCLACGAEQLVATPISIRCYCALARAFAKEHRRCAEAIAVPDPSVGRATMTGTRELANRYEEPTS